MADGSQAVKIKIFPIEFYRYSILQILILKILQILWILLNPIRKNLNVVPFNVEIKRVWFAFSFKISCLLFFKSISFLFFSILVSGLKPEADSGR